MNITWYNKNNNEGILIENAVKDGYTLVDNKSEELNSATIILMYQPKRKFEPFDMIELDNGQTYIIDDFVENELNIDNSSNILYQYTINLTSLTKELERITLPNISITKPKNGAAKSIQTVIEELIQDYSPKYLNSNGVLTRLYSNNIFIGTPCPDMQMSRPTLREAIDRVLSVVNCICRVLLVYGERKIDYIDLNSKRLPIELSQYLNYKPENQSSSDYATETENNYNNVVPNQIALVNNNTKVCEYMGFRSESMIVDDENAVLITNNPIYDLKEVLFCGDVYGTHTSAPLSINWSYEEFNGTTSFTYNKTIYVELDITNYILEEKDFNILDYETKKSRAYYSRGDNKIQGLLNYKKSFLENYVTLQNIVNLLRFNISNIYKGDIKNKVLEDIRNASHETDINEDFVNVSFGNPPDLYSFNYRQNSMFKITYEAQNENIRMRSGKYLPETNQNNIIVDNPGEAYVDIKRQGELFVNKCNRLGNRVKYLEGRFPISVQHPVVGDYLDNYVLIRTECQYYDDYVIFKGVLTENYININYFTGINARKRTWEIVSEGEAFDKELLDKWFCEFDFVDRTDDDDPNCLKWGTLTGSLINSFFYDRKYIQKALLRNSNIYYSTGSIQYRYIELDLSSYISGNSLIFNCTTQDNYSGGIRINVESQDERDVERYCKYVDDLGFANIFDVYLFRENSEFINTHWGHRLYNGQIITPGEQSSGDTYNVYKGVSKLLPMQCIYEPNEAAFINGHCLYAVRFNNHKDSREKLGFNIQFEFCSNSKRIILGEKFMERQQLINTSARSSSGLRVFACEHEYLVTEHSLIGVRTEIPEATVAINQTGYVQIALNRTITHNSIVVCDLSYNTILIVNTKNNTAGVFLNVYRTRDRNKYNSSDLKSWTN